MDYLELNRRLYRRRHVGYSWFPVDIDALAGRLRARGHRVEVVGDWRKVGHIRDGSLMFLERTLVVDGGSAFITPHKLISFGGLDLPEFRMPVPLGAVVYALLMVVVLWLWV